MREATDRLLEASLPRDSAPRGSTANAPPHRETSVPRATAEGARKGFALGVVVATIECHLAVLGHDPPHEATLRGIAVLFVFDVVLGVVASAALRLVHLVLGGQSILQLVQGALLAMAQLVVFALMFGLVIGALAALMSLLGVDGPLPFVPP